MPPLNPEHTDRDCGLFNLLEVNDPRLPPPPAGWGVEVVEDSFAAVIGHWGSRQFPAAKFNYPGPPARLRDRAWFDYSTLAVSVLACLWPPEGEQMWSIQYQGQRLTDAPALFAAFTRWVGQVPGQVLERFAEFTAADADRLFAGQGVLQMVSQRGARLAAVAASLLERWDGAVLHLVEEAGWDGPRLVELLASTVPGFEDQVSVGGYHLRFRKLAHLAAAVMASRSSVSWSGMDSFPVYPDYMLPRFLRHLGILRYSSTLAEAVDSRIEIPRHSQQEVAIRWATVHVGHRLVEELNRVGVPVTAARLDYFLWSEAVLGSEASRMGEHHRTVTLDY